VIQNAFYAKLQSAVPPLSWFCMRVVNPTQQCIGYRLNLLGVRAYRTYCQLVARSGDEWVVIGAPRPLPIEVPEDLREIGSDPLLLTAFQYDRECPGTDLWDVLAQRKAFDQALGERQSVVPQSKSA
jgi:hypothetical protein